MEEGDGLGDLMDDIWERGDEARQEYAAIESRTVARRTEIHEWQNGEAADRIAVEVLRPRIVEAVEVELKEGWRRPDQHGGEDSGVASHELVASLARHFLEAIGRIRFDWKERKAGLQLIYVFL